MISNLWFQIFLPLYKSGKEHRDIGILHVDDIAVCRIFRNVVYKTLLSVKPPFRSRSFFFDDIYFSIWPVCDLDFGLSAKPCSQSFNGMDIDYVIAGYFEEQVWVKLSLDFIKRQIYCKNTFFRKMQLCQP